MFGGEVELDESYFGGHRKGKRGRGSAGKVIVFTHKTLYLIVMNELPCAALRVVSGKKTLEKVQRNT